MNIGYECVDCDYVLDEPDYNAYTAIVMSGKCPKCGGHLHQFEERE